MCTPHSWLSTVITSFYLSPVLPNAELSAVLVLNMALALSPYQNGSQSLNASSLGNQTYCLPMFDPDPAKHAVEIQTN